MAPRPPHRAPGTTKTSIFDDVGTILDGFFNFRLIFNVSTRIIPKMLPKTVPRPSILARLPDLIFSAFMQIFDQKCRFRGTPSNPAGPKKPSQIYINLGKNGKKHMMRSTFALLVPTCFSNPISIDFGTISGVHIARFLADLWALF